MVKSLPLIPFLFFMILLLGAALFQNHLKSGPQFFLLFLGGISILSFQLNEPKGARVFFYLILGILLFENAFQISECLRNVTTQPAESGMELGSLISLFLSSLIAPIGVIIYHRTATKFPKTEQVVSWIFAAMTLVLLIKKLVS